MSAISYVMLYLIPAATSVALTVYGWRRRGSDGAGPFSLLMIAVAFWSVCHALSVASTTLDSALFWAQVQYGGIVLVSPFWLLFALAYANHWRWATRPIRLALLVPAALALAAVLTNSWRQLWWPSVQADTSRPFLSLAITRGPLFWMHAIYSYACILAGLGLFVHAMLESRLVYRNQARLVVIGALFPIVGNIAHLLGLRTQAVDDPTPFLFSRIRPDHLLRHTALPAAQPGANRTTRNLRRNRGWRRGARSPRAGSGDQCGGLPAAGHPTIGVGGAHDARAAPTISAGIRAASIAGRAAAGGVTLDQLCRRRWVSRRRSAAATSGIGRARPRGRTDNTARCHRASIDGAQARSTPD